MPTRSFIILCSVSVNVLLNVSFFILSKIRPVDEQIRSVSVFGDSLCVSLYMQLLICSNSISSCYLYHVSTSRFWTWAYRGGSAQGPLWAEARPAPCQTQLFLVSSGLLQQPNCRGQISPADKEVAALSQCIKKGQKHNMAVRSEGRKSVIGNPANT